MFVLKLWNNIMGYLVIFFQGSMPERFINMCKNKGIYIWDIEKKNESLNCAKINIDNFKKLRPIVRKTKVKVKIKEKNGLPFVINRYRKRRIAIILGISLFISFIYILSLFVWNIEVTGNETIPTETILCNLEELGLKRGTFRNNFNSKELKNKLLLKMSNLSWAKVDLSGTNVVVQVVESDLMPEIIDKNIACDIVAKQDGVISEIIVHEGIQKVYKGDTVRKGDLLVSGIAQSKEEGNIRYMHSRADIKIRTWHEESMDVFYLTNLFEETGEEEYSYTIKLFGKYIDFGNYNSSFMAYNKETSERKLFNLPISVMVNKYKEKEKIENIPSRENLIEETKIKILNKIKNNLSKNVEIVNIKVYTVDINNGINVKLIVECLESGGIDKIIDNDGGFISGNIIE